MAKDWLNEISSTGLRDTVTTSFLDDQFTYSETLDFLEKAAFGGFSSSELGDLKYIYSQDVFEKSLEKAKKRIEREKKAKIKQEKLKASVEPGIEQSS